MTTLSLAAQATRLCARPLGAADYGFVASSGLTLSKRFLAAAIGHRRPWAPMSLHPTGLQRGIPSGEPPRPDGRIDGFPHFPAIAFDPLAEFWGALYGGSFTEEFKNPFQRFPYRRLLTRLRLERSDTRRWSSSRRGFSLGVDLQS